MNDEPAAQSNVPSETPAAPPQASPPAKGPSVWGNIAAFFKGIPADLRAARRSSALGKTIRTLQRTKQQRQKELEDALRALGVAAEEARVEPDLPTAQAVAAARQALLQAEATAEAKRADFKQARDTLGTEQKTHTDIIAEREAAYKPFADALTAALSAVTEIERKIAAADHSLRLLQTELVKAVDAEAAIQAAAPPPAPGQPTPAAPAPPPRPSGTVQADLARAQADRDAAMQEMGIARQKQAEAQSAADAKSADIRAAKKAWEERKAQLTEVVQAAEAARTEAEAAVATAQKSLAEAHLALGNTLFAAPTVPAAIAEPLAKAREIADAVAGLDKQIADTQAEKDTFRAATRRFQITAAAGLGILVVLVLLILRICKVI
jgi:hypothetical protein